MPNKSTEAFKHGISEEDIRTAIERFVYNEIMEDDMEIISEMVRERIAASA